MSTAPFYPGSRCGGSKRDCRICGTFLPVSAAIRRSGQESLWQSRSRRKKCGVQTGEPVAMALRKCPNMVIVPSDFDLYVRCSRAFKKICAAYTPVMESFSIDEVFLDMTGTSLLYPDPIAAAHEIKDRITRSLDLPSILESPQINSCQNGI